ncbi:MAG: DUF4142 domain-containing protein [Bacteroidota bacterium]|jgi:putative membrane protein|nr:DUF4142 domain-containing protein [Bacteroidota bacterium]
MNTAIKFFTIFCICLIISCGSPESNNERTESAPEGTAEAVVAADEDLQEDSDYLVSAHINSQLQIALGKIANRQSQSPEIQQFGQEITQENKVIQHNISALASGTGVEIEPALTPEYSAVIDSIQSYSGKEFDVAFLDLVIEEHNEDIDRFTSISSKTSNPVVRDILTDNLEILRRRKNKAEELRDSLN